MDPSKLLQILRERAKNDEGLIALSQRRGDDLAKPRLVGFELAADSEDVALRARDFINGCGYGDAHAHLVDGEWQLLVYARTPLFIDQVCCISGMLTVVASMFGLRHDGWGTLLQGSLSSEARPSMTAERPQQLLEELVGEQLSAVTFVQDCLQLSFDGPTINVTNPLTVRTSEASSVSSQPGFRDLLCAQIAKKVAGVEYVAGQRLAIRFADGATLAVSLLRADYSSPKAYYAHGFKNRGWWAE